jgi:hypothetical protein
MDKSYCFIGGILSAVAGALFAYLSFQGWTKEVTSEMFLSVLVIFLTTATTAATCFAFAFSTYLFYLFVEEVHEDRKRKKSQ